jgi:hypothetical protein
MSLNAGTAHAWRHDAIRALFDDVLTRPKTSSYNAELHSMVKRKIYHRNGIGARVAVVEKQTRAI